MHPKTYLVPIFFDEKRFVADIENRDPIDVFRGALGFANNHFNKRFNEGENVHQLVNERAHFADLILRHAWNRFEWDADISLIAVGGYGRGELHPHSDIDLLILMRRDKPDRYRQSIEQFLTFLWDIQLKIGHSTRSVSQCVDEARGDITVATNLMETRLLAGSSELLEKLKAKTGPKKIWASETFYQGKIAEQRARHRKHGDTEYNLEPNIKEAPGGLRDIQVFNWTAKRHFQVHRRSLLIAEGFLSEEEYVTVRRDEEFLWKVRYGLHLITDRPEERLLFDYQRKLAVMFGYKDSPERLGVEKFMQRYYQVVMSIRELNEVLLEYLDEAIYRKNKVKVVTPINARFVIRDNDLGTTDASVFIHNPSALLELFAIMGENDSIEGIRASTIRQIRLHRGLINDKFRADPENRALFMRILKAPYKLSNQLQRMNRYGILGGYLPEFGKIVGQMQHDLFHIYPVDVHTLEVVRNVRRLTLPDVAAKFPVAAHIYKNFRRRELIVIAALYHDIAKGRGGDHSTLGKVDIANFAERHGLQPQEVDLLKWLVENHLLMSTISQREDTSDPDVIHKFATHVGDQMHLDYLYVLTVADINATNPRLWTEWKGSLMHNLYFETKRALQLGTVAPFSRAAWVREAKDSALRALGADNIVSAEAISVWRDVDEDFFLRESAEDVAEFTKAILANQGAGKAVILISDVGEEIPVATQIFVHSKDRQNNFSIIASALDRLNLNIHDARLNSNSEGSAFDVFYVLDEQDQPIGKDSLRCEKILQTLHQAIANPTEINIDVQQRTPRQLKNFALKTAANLRHDVEANCVILEIITPDRPGLLAHLTQIFVRFELRVLHAKISTLGERVEDIFYLTDKNLEPLTDSDVSAALIETIRRELDQRNKEEGQEYKLRNMKKWN
ncbi:[protein-PII] uridylyltransferase [SAR92 clade bacterium H455]|uniref:Bifunctional uridylyltransferase/uridylyl-removing enzyme n=1 Tax=SAR92 clade bacterium H455 TaxID=2974818 RepID=A0ABY5TJX4_9GAMM|nr:[protein-PII] uridylyltransferase [SAR92 clade bacterium H455]